MGRARGGGAVMEAPVDDEDPVPLLGPISVLLGRPPAEGSTLESPIRVASLSAAQGGEVQRGGGEDDLGGVGVMGDVEAGLHP